jgi:hypothetical protein
VDGDYRNPCWLKGNIQLVDYNDDPTKGKNIL